jgi:hypothetical protein
MSRAKCRRAATRAGIAAAAVVAALLAASPAGANTYTVTMDGAQQCASGLPCDPDGSGTAVINVDPLSSQVCGTFNWTNVAAPVGFGHIHEAAPGQPENPGFTINLFGPPTSLNGFPSGTSGCMAVTKYVSQLLVKYPYMFMVTIHNTQYPGGAIRGQLGPGRFCDFLGICPLP